MAASIDFTDTVGAATLTVYGLDGRFNNWSPDPRPIDVAARSMGTGEIITREFRENAAVRFEAGVLQADKPVAARLMKHLWGGGICSLNTDDATAVVFTDLGIAVEGGQRVKPDLARSDAATIDYRLTLALQYVGIAVPTDLNVVY